VDRLDGRSLERTVKRVIVLGGTGHFGRAAADELRRRGIPVQTAARRGPVDLQLNANDPESIRAVLQAGDVVLDAAGPFHARSIALLAAAIEVGFDVIDLNDNLQYAEAVLLLAPAVESAGIRLLSSASTVSAVAAALIRRSGMARPRSVTAFLVPASRHTANAGAALSLLRCVGGPVRVLCDGRLQDFPGWSYPRRFPMPPPLGTICGRLFESADALYLPRIWPSLRDVAIYVDTNVSGVNTLLRFAARSPTVRRLLERQVTWSTWLARALGSSAGGIGYEIEDAAGQVARFSIVSTKNSFLTAIAPAVLAAQAIAEDRFPARGLVLPDRHVEPKEVFAFLESNDIAINGSA
jgi:hypothetical protein